MTSTRIVFELSDFCPSCGVDVADHLFRLGDVHGVEIDLATGRVKVSQGTSRPVPVESKTTSPKAERSPRERNSI